jgi:hypothetical protein
MNDAQILLTLKEFTDTLDQLAIGYAIGGSIASSVYGKVRFTEDADITVEPFESRADNLFELLKPTYYISKEAMYHALSKRSSFNIIHLENAFKIDVFVRKDTDFQKQLVPRSKPLQLSESLPKPLSVVSPEDIILLKLQWYQAAAGSERQWNDVLGVLAVRAEKLDFDYLNKWAACLGISELLAKARRCFSD